jgi:hypothetical protein
MIPTSTTTKHTKTWLRISPRSSSPPSAGRPPLLLADGLDKRTSVADVELALSDEFLLRELNAPVILTGPVHLRHDARFRSVPGNFRLALLYNVPVCEPDGQRGDAGVALLRTLYEQRCRRAGFTPDLPPELVDEAARMSSGIVREFLSIMYETCKMAFKVGDKYVADAHLRDTIKARRLELQNYLNENSLKILAHVLDKRVVPAGDDADTLLFENFIACYPNGDVWFRPHEILVDYVRKQASSE